MLLSEWSKNTKMNDNKTRLEILYEALSVAKEGLKLLIDNPIANKTLKEIDKITNKLFKK